MGKDALRSFIKENPFVLCVYYQIKYLKKNSLSEFEKTWPLLITILHSFSIILFYFFIIIALQLYIANTNGWTWHVISKRYFYYMHTNFFFLLFDTIIALSLILKTSTHMYIWEYYNVYLVFVSDSSDPDPDIMVTRAPLISKAVAKAPEGEGCPRCGGYVYAAEQMLARGRVSNHKRISSHRQLHRSFFGF